MCWQVPAQAQSRERGDITYCSTSIPTPVADCPGHGTSLLLPLTPSPCTSHAPAHKPKSSAAAPQIQCRVKLRCKLTCYMRHNHEPSLHAMPAQPTLSPWSKYWIDQHALPQYMCMMANIRLAASMPAQVHVSQQPYRGTPHSNWLQASVQPQGAGPGAAPGSAIT